MVWTHRGGLTSTDKIHDGAQAPLHSQVELVLAVTLGRIVYNWQKQPCHRLGLQCVRGYGRLMLILEPSSWRQSFTCDLVRYSVTFPWEGKLYFMFLSVTFEEWAMMCLESFQSCITHTFPLPSEGPKRSGVTIARKYISFPGFVADSGP